MSLVSRGRLRNFATADVFLKVSSKMPTGIYKRTAKHCAAIRASLKGRVLSLEHKAKIKKARNRGAVMRLKNGYALVKFMERWVYAHRLAAVYYWGPDKSLAWEQPLISPGYVIHHINEDRLDNRETNLEIMTRIEHKNHHYVINQGINRGN